MIDRLMRYTAFAIYVLACLSAFYGFIYILNMWYNTMPPMLFMLPLEK